MRSRARGVAVGAVATLIALVTLSERVRSDQPVTSSVRFTRQIMPIMERKCLPCHAPGGLAISLANYREVRAWGRAIREEIVEQRMPPSLAAPGYGRFENELALTAREETTMLMWIDGGMPRGDARDLPPQLTPGGDASGDPPDRRFDAPAQTVPAEEEFLIRRVTIETGLEADRWVRRVVVRPGDRRVLRGALVFGPSGAPGSLGPTGPDRAQSSAGSRKTEGKPRPAESAALGQWLGAWLPWQNTLAPPEPHAFLLPARARLTLVLYYRGAEQPVVDRPAIELYFATDGPRRSIGEVVINARPDGRLSRSARQRRLGEVKLPSDSTVWALQPSPGKSAASLELRARRPDGSVEVLLWIPEYRHEWPQALVFQQPTLLPSGTILSLIAYSEASGRSAPGAPFSSSRIAVSVLR